MQAGQDEISMDLTLIAGKKKKILQIAAFLGHLGTENGTIQSL
jgi:hypothetical protein